MNPKFNEMLAKKRKMKPAEKHAKMSVLHDLKGALADDMGDKLGGLKKVSVMSNSPQGMQAGLDKAKMMADGSPQDPAMMFEGGLANSGPMDGEESYHGYGPMDENAKSKDMDSEEPEHVSYDGSPDAEMGPGYAEGGEVEAGDMSYSGPHSEDGFKHPDSDESDEIDYSGDASSDDGFKHPNDRESMHGYAKGGKVKSPVEEAADSVDEERGETEGDMSDTSERHPEFKDLNLQEVEEKLQHLMQMKKQMEQQ